NIGVRPLTWPIGMGDEFKGVYNLYEKEFRLFDANKTSISDELYHFKDLDDPKLDEIIGEESAEELREEVALIEGVYEAFDEQKYLSGTTAPVFFGSAVNNFGIQELLDTFVA